MMTCTFVLLIAPACGLTAAAALIRGLLRVPHMDREPPRDLLILAAHQDDCVVLAGEYAIETARAGRRIQIVYLTCGAQMPEDDRARLRRQEAETAWGMLGVTPGELHDLALPQSDVSGPSGSTSEELGEAKRNLRRIVEQLAPGTAVFIPAAGESHVDHRTLRQVSLEVIDDAGRKDLMVLESPEYNDYYSLLHCPWRSLAFVARSIPLLGRWVRPGRAWMRAGFADGPVPLVLPLDPVRLARKKQLLRQFGSEDGELLVKYFGYPDRFRPIGDVHAARKRPEDVGLYLRFDGQCLGLSVLLLWLSLWFSAALIGAGAVWLVAMWRRPAGIGFALASVGVLLFCLLRARGLCRRAMLISVSVGLLWGVAGVLK
jgi:LmbE family N-acetylglucosaminyl deacetylase